MSKTTKAILLVCGIADIILAFLVWAGLYEPSAGIIALTFLSCGLFMLSDALTNKAEK